MIHGISHIPVYQGLQSEICMYDAGELLPAAPLEVQPLRERDREGHESPTATGRLQVNPSTLNPKPQSFAPCLVDQVYLCQSSKDKDRCPSLV